MEFDTTRLGRQELHDLIGNAMVPLPIAFITTVGEDGSYNAAPFSFAAPVCAKPPTIVVSFARNKGQKKDTLRNIEFSGDFVINVVDEGMIKQAVHASADFPSGTDELKAVGLTAAMSVKVKSPRVAESKISMECRLVQKMELVEEGNGLRAIVFGEVVQMNVRDEVLVNGEIDPSRLKAVGRLGRSIYCWTGDTFEVKRPRI